MATETLAVASIRRISRFVAGFVLVAPLSFPSPRDDHQRVLVAPLSFPSPRDDHQLVHVVRGERRLLGHVFHPAINRIEDLCENRPMSQATKRFATPSGTCWCFGGRSAGFCIVCIGGGSSASSTSKRSAAAPFQRQTILRAAP